ncbi:hypothetical protein QBC41DRAFT_300494 [Cercophora samala]|uniref:Uncharacterized protein n=1 Tax=Cercophora samala TaxID=330535 RepID=A0AA39ZI87_9PEZI|nr:hypothetical protein QBC41DRAFT_300494 [Cercophora samala]
MATPVGRNRPLMRPPNLDLEQLPPVARTYIQNLEDEMASMQNQSVSYPDLILQIQEEQALNKWLDRELTRLHIVLEHYLEETHSLTAEVNELRRLPASSTISAFADRSDVMTSTSLEQKSEAEPSNVPYSTKVVRPRDFHVEKEKYPVGCLRASKSPTRKALMAELATIGTAPNNDNALAISQQTATFDHDNDNRMPSSGDGHTCPPQLPANKGRGITPPLQIRPTPSHIDQQAISDFDINRMADLLASRDWGKVARCINCSSLAPPDEAGSQPLSIEARYLATSTGRLINQIQTRDKEVEGNAQNGGTKQQVEMASRYTKLKSGLKKEGKRGRSKGRHVRFLLVEEASQDVIPYPRSTSFALEAEKFLNNPDSDDDSGH